MAGKKKRKRKSSDGLSLRTMTLCVMALVAYLCWAIAASSYLGALVEPMAPRGPRDRISGLSFFFAAIATFLGNSLRIDNLPAVFMNSLRHHPWHFVLFGVLETLAIGLGLWMKKLEQELNPPKRRPRTEP